MGKHLEGMSTMRDDAFENLQELLGEMQSELSGRRWTEKPWDRCTRAAELRGKMWEAICAYRDFYSPMEH